MTKYIRLTKRGYLFSKPSGLILHLLGLLDWKIRDWEFYTENEKRLKWTSHIVAILFGVIMFVNSFSTLSIIIYIAGFLVTFSLIPTGPKELERFKRL